MNKADTLTALQQVHQLEERAGEALGDPEGEMVDGPERYRHSMNRNWAPRWAGPR